ncbi:hypothetical protein BH10PLA1_BH10PLA1_15240 [soil metagenome]
MEPSKSGAEPAGSSPLDDAVVQYNARLGIGFFLVYLAVYAAFVLLCTFKLEFMSQPWIGGVNVAVWYGFGLIIAAFVMAAAYLVLCKR